MGVPKTSDLYHPILRLMSDGKPWTNQLLIATLFSEFGLSQDDLSELIPSGTPRFNKNVEYAKFRLYKCGFLQKSAKFGEYVITETGASISRRSVFPEKLFWDTLKGRKRLPHGDATRCEPNSFRGLRELRSMPPSRFEQVVADAFNQMGYSATVIGKSGDRGVDIEVRNLHGELWAIAQCKRYGVNGFVTPSEVRDFAGAYLLVKPCRGFLITTGRLSQDAMETSLEFEWMTVIDHSGILGWLSSYSPYKVNENPNHDDS